MSHLIRASRLKLASTLITMHLSVLQSGHTLAGLGLSSMEPMVVPYYALFRVTDDELRTAIRVMSEALTRFGLRRITVDEARLLLSQELAKRRSMLQQMPRGVSE